MTLKGFIRELRTPALRCERMGHVWIVERRSGLAKPWWTGVVDEFHYRCVACRVYQKRENCKRCHAPHPEFGEWRTVRNECRQGVTLDSRDHERLATNGVVWI